MLTRKQLELLLNRGVSLMKLDTHYEITNVVAGKYMTEAVKEAELISIDARLPRVIDLLIARKGGGSLLGTESLSNTLDYWNQPHKIKAGWNNQYTLKYMTHIHHGGSLVDSPQYVTVNGGGYEVFSCDGIEFAGHTIYGDFVVAKSHLDQHFPGWEERLRVMDAIDPESEDKLDFVLLPANTTPSCHDELQGVDFE